MKLTNDKTDPSVRTVLAFSDEEVISALITYAKEKGYLFVDKQVTLWHSDIHATGIGEKEEPATKLVIGSLHCVGTTCGIVLQRGKTDGS